MSRIYPVRLSDLVTRAENRLSRGSCYEEIFHPLQYNSFCVYDYPAVQDLFRIYMKWAEICGDPEDLDRQTFIRDSLTGNLPEIRPETEQAETAFLQNSSDDSFGSYHALFSWYYRNDLYLETFLTDYFLRRRFPAQVNWDRFWMWSTPNFGLLKQALDGDENGSFMIICRQIGRKERVFERMIRAMGKDVKVLSTDEPEFNDVISSHRQPGGILLGELRVLYELSRQPSHRRAVKVLTSWGRPHSVRWSLGWYGDYLSYISQIYGEDCHPLLDKEPTKRFSIVIPARNSSCTLRHTLQTCLEQTYDGAYEIIVSDNSTGQNADVYALCRELDDPHIRYLKTPRDLHLPKSFEFAILHAAGEYILPIGSDDGLLPWALEMIDEIAGGNPDEEIIQWERGFYAWPGFNGGQQHQLIIPRDYRADAVTLSYREGADLIAAVLVDPRNMYALPMLYINSCFKRSYMHTLLEETGSLWDGMCQDIYMGVVTACIKPRILTFQYPLSIAGMSDGSVGARANVGQKTDEEFREIMATAYQDSNIGGYWYSYHEHLSPETGTDVSTLYACLLRAVSMGILPESYLSQVFDWKKMFLNLYHGLDIRDVAYDRKMHQMLYAAMQHGDEFEAWFRETVYEPGLKPREIDDAAVEAAFLKKRYRSGERNAEGGITLDASEYGVSDIHGAVRLFASAINHMSHEEVTFK